MRMYAFRIKSAYISMAKRVNGVIGARQTEFRGSGRLTRSESGTYRTLARRPGRCLPRVLAVVLYCPLCSLHLFSRCYDAPSLCPSP